MRYHAPSILSSRDQFKASDQMWSEPAIATIDDAVVAIFSPIAMPIILVFFATVLYQGYDELTPWRPPPPPPLPPPSTCPFLLLLTQSTLTLQMVRR